VTDAASGSRKIAAYCKSFSPDFDHLALLLSTFEAHNPEHVTLTVSLPRSDIAAFYNTFGHHLPDVQVVADEAYCEHDLTKYPGWLGQQICKLMSWRVVEPQHYVLLDSDCYLIRDLRPAEMVPRERPYVAYGSLIRTVLKDDNTDLLKYIRGDISPDAYLPKGGPRKDELERFLDYRTRDPDNPGPIERSDIPMKAFGASQWVFYQPGQIFCRDVVTALIDDLKRRKLTAGDLIRISPWEYNWYGEFISSRFFDQTEFRVSPFIHFQEVADLVFARRLGLDEAALAKTFLFVQMASRHLQQKRLDD
jgi:hypothetical protein